MGLRWGQGAGGKGAVSRSRWHALGASTGCWLPGPVCVAHTLKVQSSADVRQHLPHWAYMGADVVSQQPGATPHRMWHVRQRSVCSCTHLVAASTYTLRG